MPEESGAKAAGQEEQNKPSPPQVLALPKHPLQYKWVLWYCKHDKGPMEKPWEECVREVASFQTVEDFWALYNHIQLASGLSVMSDYYLFKEGIKPMWEDPANKSGGRWLVIVDRAKRAELLDHYWLELLMAMVGEQFHGEGHNISGAVVNIRNKGDKVSLWTKHSESHESNKKIGLQMKKKLGIEPAIPLKYEAHVDTSRKTCSHPKPAHVI